MENNKWWYNVDMLDVKFIRENLELVEKSAKEKGYKVDVKEILDLDEKRKKELVEVEKLRQKRNEIAAKMKGGKPEPELVEAGKAVKRELTEKEEALAKVDAELKAILKVVPNIIFDDVRIADACEISDDDWSKGLDYYWHDMMEDNPLRD